MSLGTMCRPAFSGMERDAVSVGFTGRIHPLTLQRGPSPHMMIKLGLDIHDVRVDGVGGQDPPSFVGKGIHLGKIAVCATVSES